MITIVDYGAGNGGSIVSMLDRLGVEAEIVSSADGILKANKLILPGVGSFDFAMQALKSRGLVSVLNEAVLHRKIPILGICLGMQLMLDKSEEGSEQGLGWIEGALKKFSFNSNEGLDVPHMRWAELKVSKDALGLNNVGDVSRFYFAHSYFAHDVRQENILATTLYGHEFVSAIIQDNIYGVQFHPEKSHRFGLKLLKSFAEI